MKNLRWLVLLAAALTAGIASAQQYRWIDEKGKVHYSDTPPPPSAKSVQKKNLTGNAVGAQPNTQLTQAMKKAPVTLFTHPECTEACTVARAFLNKRGVPFREVSATTEAAMGELKSVSGGLDVPVLVVGDQVEKFALEQNYERALDAAGYPPRGVVPPRDAAAAGQLQPAAPAAKP